MATADRQAPPQFDSGAIDLIREAIESLTPLERAFLELRLNLDGRGERTLEDVAKRLNLSLGRAGIVELQARSALHVELMRLRWR